ncbi:hypothetical protein FHS27_005595 [Rhodopirellula rubra]|uniref:Uncharacterized protein n=1 Tax=Aporhodopirellula rubra TaxID=980271 RepID=A0A7W5H949_9BACT|nr:hypothetical protein [Aporhodopirellula rubra]
MSNGNSEKITVDNRWTRPNYHDQYSIDTKPLDRQVMRRTPCSPRTMPQSLKRFIAHASKHSGNHDHDWREINSLFPGGSSDALRPCLDIAPADPRPPWDFPLVSQGLEYADV